MLTVTNKMITAGPARATQGIDFPKADRWGNTIRLETQRMYDSALCYARRDHFKTARCVFRRLLEKEDPRMCKAWVSWAQVRMCSRNDSNNILLHARHHLQARAQNVLMMYCPCRWKSVPLQDQSAGTAAVKSCNVAWRSTPTVHV